MEPRKHPDRREGKGGHDGVSRPEGQGMQHRRPRLAAQAANERGCRQLVGHPHAPHEERNHQKLAYEGRMPERVSPSCQHAPRLQAFHEVRGVPAYGGEEPQDDHARDEDRLRGPMACSAASRSCIEASFESEIPRRAKTTSFWAM